jgi:hypothetical protein
MRVLMAVLPRRVTVASSSISSSKPAGPRKRTVASATTMSVPSFSITL